MAGLFFVQKLRFFVKHLPILQKKYFFNPVRVSLAILMQIKKKNCFCSSFKFAVVLHGENPALTISFVYTTQSCSWKKNNLNTTE